jgi:hypothetical protein
MPALFAYYPKRMHLKSLLSAGMDAAGRGEQLIWGQAERPSAPELERQLGGGNVPSWRLERPRLRSGHVQAKEFQIHGDAPDGSPC